MLATGKIGKILVLKNCFGKENGFRFRVEDYSEKSRQRVFQEAKSLIPSHFAPKDGTENRVDNRQRPEIEEQNLENGGQNNPQRYDKR